LDHPADLARLLARLGLASDAAYDAHWSAAPDFLDLLASHMQQARPRQTVECGSGLSTLVLARCCALNGTGHVHSLEHGPEFAARTRTELLREGLADYATVIDAPLVEVSLAGESYRWYDLGGLHSGNIDMLVIDGPPGHVQRHARYPALPMLAGRLSDSALLLLDDAARNDEQEVVRLWLERYPALAHEYIAVTRGCSILRKLPEVKRSSAAGG